MEQAQRRRALSAERHRRLRDRRIRRRRRHHRQGALDGRLLGRRARTGPAAHRGRSSITTSSARSCRASNANNPATQPQTFRATPAGQGAESAGAHLRPAGRRQQRALHRQLLAAPPERFQRGQRARRCARHGARRLADHLRRARAVLHEGRVGAGRLGRAGPVRSAAVAALSDAAAAGEVVRRAARARRAGARASPAAVADGDQLAVLQRPARLPALRLLPVLHVRVPLEVDVDGDDAAAWRRRPAAARSGRTATSRASRPGRDGRATGVAYFDAQKRLQLQRAKAVVLCANGAETPRLLLNSESSRFPNGLANSSGVVGKHLMFNTYFGVNAQFEHPLNEYKSVQNTRMVLDFYETDPKRGFYGGGGIDARFGKYPIIVRARRAAAGIADVGRGLRAQPRRAVLAHDVLRHTRHVAAARDQQRHARSRRSRTRGGCRACASPTRIIPTI